MLLPSSVDQDCTTPCVKAAMVLFPWRDRHRETTRPDLPCSVQFWLHCDWPRKPVKVRLLKLRCSKLLSGPRLLTMQPAQWTWHPSASVPGIRCFYLLLIATPAETGNGWFSICPKPLPGQNSVKLLVEDPGWMKRGLLTLKVGFD